MVEIRPLPGKQLNDCVNIVAEQVAACGGRTVKGWAIWEWPKVMIEAEFHVVWEDVNGQLLDLTPKILPFSTVLFLPDKKLRYEGRQIDNIRKPLSKNSDIDRFLHLAHSKYLEMNKGELANYHGPVAITPAVDAIQREMALLVAKLSKKYGPP